uniref:Uncharacterized protein n=1 Tax=Candidatus Kentrum sp. LPFa TaxID=2126335 RepID=A0A450W8C3_9GAMM|nr:MAG: hypothetical protein BECKLPF1236A_GA0070988_100862 [Candidatus Kentron sp. LPFa]VFK31270.1 MAG: hypothetical protein BECKLPF1236C_GA0070990_101332 [Candidatus Kentron sp. LPFa]
MSSRKGLIEYFLETEVGGFSTIDDTNPVAFHDDLLKWKDEITIDEASEDDEMPAVGMGTVSE